GEVGVDALDDARGAKVAVGVIDALVEVLALLVRRRARRGIALGPEAVEVGFLLTPRELGEVVFLLLVVEQQVSLVEQLAGIALPAAGLPRHVEARHAERGGAG